MILGDLESYERPLAPKYHFYGARSNSSAPLAENVGSVYLKLTLPKKINFRGQKLAKSSNLKPTLAKIFFRSVSTDFKSKGPYGVDTT